MVSVFKGFAAYKEAERKVFINYQNKYIYFILNRYRRGKTKGLQRREINPSSWEAGEKILKQD